MLIQFDAESGARIGNGVRLIEQIAVRTKPLVFPGVSGGLVFPLIIDNRSTRFAIRIGKYTGSTTWAKHTAATIAIWEDGTPPNETSSSATIENVVNHWADVPANKWVGVQRGRNGHYYLVVAEC